MVGPGIVAAVQIESPREDEPERQRQNEQSGFGREARATDRCSAIDEHVDPDERGRESG